MKLFLTHFFIAAFVSLSAINPHSVETNQTNVYICNSTTATKYHLTSNCRGLNACDQKIIKVTKEEAIKQGKKTLCGWED